jgi:hypothetical protein
MSKFDLKDKKIGFYSCTKNSNTNGNGLLSKKDFFLYVNQILKAMLDGELLLLMKKKRWNQKDLMQ